MKKDSNIGIFLALLIILVIVAFMIVNLLNKPVYTVNFNTSGGSVMASLEIKAKEKLTKPLDPTRDGYIFLGWYVGDEEFDFNESITKDITLVAKWQQVEHNTVTLSFDSLGGSEVDDITIEAGTVLESIPNPTKEDYLFVGWYYQNKEYDFAKPITTSMTFVAKWKVDTTKKYTVSFDSQGGSIVDSIKVSENSVVTIPASPIRSGYTFIGWYLGEDEFDFTTLITEDITLTAKWGVND